MENIWIYSVPEFFDKTINDFEEYSRGKKQENYLTIEV